MEVRIVNLRNEAAWFDEISTLQHLTSPTLAEFLSRCQDLNPFPPVYMVAEYAWSRLTGDSVLAQRTLSVVFGLGSLAGLYGFTRSLFGARSALFATLWAAFMPWHVYYSQEIRFYALVVLLAAFSMWTFVYMVERGTLRWLFLHAALNWLLAWTHPLTLVLFLAQGLFLLLFRRTNLRVLCWWMAAHLPLAVSLYEFQAHTDWPKLDVLAAWIPGPRMLGASPSLTSFLFEASGSTGADATTEWVPFTVWGRVLAPLFTATGWALAAIAAVASFSALRAAWIKKKEAPRETNGPLFRSEEKVALLALVFFLPPLCLFAGSLLWRPMFLERYLVYSMLPLYVVVGRFVASRRSIWTTVALLCLPVFSYVAFYFPGPSRTPYDRVAMTMRANGAHRPTVFAGRGVYISAIQFYAGDLDPQIYPPAAFERLVSGRAQSLQECWFVASPKQLDDLRNSLIETGGLITVWRFPAEHSVDLVHWIPVAVN
jgi:hypothetical protein